MNIKRNIIFSLESRKKDGIIVTDNIPIRMRVIFCGTRIDFSTGYRIDAAKWDADKQRVKNGCTNKLKQSASEINADLLMYYTDIQNIFKGFEVQNIVPKPEQIREAFANRHKQPEIEAIDEQPAVVFYDAFDEFVKECGSKNHWEIATFKIFENVKNHLKKFDEKLTFEKIDETWLTAYVKYLFDVLLHRFALFRCLQFETQ